MCLRTAKDKFTENDAAIPSHKSRKKKDEHEIW